MDHNTITTYCITMYVENKHIYSNNHKTRITAFAASFSCINPPSRLGLSKYIFSAPTTSHTTVDLCEGLNAGAICERSAALEGRKRGACRPAITAPANPRPQFGNRRARLAAAVETTETGVHVERPPVAPPVAERAEAFHLF